jgi:hypothetical protein
MHADEFLAAVDAFEAGEMPEDILLSDVVPEYAALWYEWRDHPEAACGVGVLGYADLVPVGSTWPATGEWHRRRCGVVHDPVHPETVATLSLKNWSVGEDATRGRMNNKSDSPAIARRAATAAWCRSLVKEVAADAS